jgi:hypothetical protein
MDRDLVERVREAQRVLEPQFKELRQAVAALKTAVRLAEADKPDALPMHKALLKLEASTTKVPDDALWAAADAFRRETERALDALAFDFAKDLRDTFAGRGVDVTGRPPALLVGDLVLRIDVAARRAQWFYGQEPLTGRLPLSAAAIVAAYERQRRLIAQGEADPAEFLRELFATWSAELQGRSRRPAGNRLNLVDTFAKMTLARQSARFWNAPSRQTFRDYPRPQFVRDLVQAQAAPTISVDGRLQHLRLGVATKSQADSSSRSVWLPSGSGGLDGAYYSDVTFEEAPA